MHRHLLILLACLALLVAGCGGDDEEEPAGGGGEALPTVEAGGEAGGGVRISMKDVKFTPANATVKVGQVVTWINDDPIEHTATATSGGDFDSGNVKAGDTYEFTAEEPGTIQYVCTIHPSQKGTLTVTP